MKTLATIALAWVALSVPAGIVIGKLIRGPKARPVPGREPFNVQKGDQ